MKKLGKLLIVSFVPFLLTGCNLWNVISGSTVESFYLEEMSPKLAALPKTYNTDELFNAIDKMKNLENLTENYNIFNDELVNLVSTYTVAEMYYYGKGTVEEYQNMRSLLNKYYESLDKYVEACLAIKNSPLKFNFFGTLDDTAIDNYIASWGGGGSNEIELAIADLENEFNNLDPSDNYTYKSMEIYKKIIAKYNQIAINKGYANYLDYCYGNVYGRDYKYSSSKLLTKNIKESFIPIIDKYEYPRLTSKEQDLMDAYSYNNYRYDKIDALAAFESYTQSMSNSYIRVYNKLWNDGYYYFSDSEKFLTTAYSTYIDNINEYCLYFSRDYQNIMTVIHEFGHHFACVSNPLNETRSYDILEIHSTGNEFNFLNHLNQFETGKEHEKVINAFVDYKVYRGLISSLHCSYVVDFETYAFTHPNDTVEQLVAELNRLYQEEYDSGVSYNYWAYPCILNPGYYVSYAYADVCSLQFYVTGLNDLSQAKSNYLSLTSSLATSNSNVIKDGGLLDPFEEETYSIFGNIL